MRARSGLCAQTVSPCGKTRRDGTSSNRRSGVTKTYLLRPEPAGVVAELTHCLVWRAHL